MFTYKLITDVIFLSFEIMNHIIHRLVGVEEVRIILCDQPVRHYSKMPGAIDDGAIGQLSRM